MRASLLILPLLAACTDYNIKPRDQGDGGGPALSATPNPMLFGELPETQSTTQVLTIQSVGDATLNLTGMEITTGAEWFTLVTPLTEVFGAYAPGETVEAVVAFTSNGQPTDGRITLLSNDASSPTSYVDLLGGTAAPDLVIEPDSVNFGAAPVGTTKQERVTLRNVGDSPLTITAMSTTDPVFGTLPSFALPLVIEAQGSADLTLTFAPDRETTFTGELQVDSNDPNGQEIARLSGSAGNRPVAVCDVTPREVEAINGSADWLGEQSYDPGGYAITNYAWRLVSQPTGSAVSMPNGSSSSPNRTGFRPDIVGTYTAELKVRNSLNMESDPCTVSLEALPFGGLWIEMFWQHSNDDMDLHLIRSDYAGSQTMLSQSPNDCYFANCTGSFGGGLDWGQSGYTGDNPRLDLDDIPGTGPENINIDQPENISYTIWVRDYAGTGTYVGTNMVTVKVYARGILMWEDTRNCDGEGDHFPFAQVNWGPVGQITVDPI